MLMLLSFATGVEGSIDGEVDDMPFRQVRKVIMALETMKAVEATPKPVPQLSHQVPQEAPVQSPPKKTGPEKPWNDNDEEEWQKHLDGGGK